MSKPTVDERIWKILINYAHKLSLKERLDIACRIDDLVEENKKSTPELDRIMALESTVEDLVDKLVLHENKLNRQSLQLEDLTSDTTKTHELTVAVGRIVDGHTGQISELTEQVKTLHSQLATVTDDYALLKKCIEEFARQIYREIM